MLDDRSAWGEGAEGVVDKSAVGLGDKIRRRRTVCSGVSCRVRFQLQASSRLGLSRRYGDHISSQPAINRADGAI